MPDPQRRDPEDSLNPLDDDALDDEALDDEALDDEGALDEDALDDEGALDEEASYDDFDEPPVGDEEEEGEEAAQRLDLDVQVEAPSACERHITVTVPREDIDRYFDEEFDELMPTAQVPGFRPGRAPRKLVEARFRKQLSEKVKNELLLDSLSQASEEENLSAIGEPDIDLESVEIPESGPLVFEFNLEVRPEFELPQWKGLRLQRPVREFSREDIDTVLRRLLANRGRLVPFDGPADRDDYVTVNLAFRHGERVLSRAEEQTLRLRPVLSFRDGKIEGFDEALRGVRAGQRRQAEARLSEDAPNRALQGQTVTAEFEVLDVKRLETPELTPELLDELGGFELEADLRDAIHDTLLRRLTHEQRQAARRQITDALTEAADWELPPDLLERQSRREMERTVLELRRNGFTEEEIRARANELRQHSRMATARALKEHFVLERIAEEEEITATDADFNDEIMLIAQQSGESSRRVRARLEKSGSMDVLQNQVIERKVLDRILEHAEFEDVPYEMERDDIEAVDLLAGGGDRSDIPEAKADKQAPAPAGRPEEPHLHE